jgi:predicted nucleic-acid-binding protein
MIGLDTNILVRYLVQGDPIQSPQATEILERRLSEREPGYVSVVAMTETVWVLQRTYRLGDPAVAAVIEGLLRTDAVVIQNEQEVFAAMIALKDGRGSFADALIGALDTKAGCLRTLTFDQGALRLPGFASP